MMTQFCWHRYKNFSHHPCFWLTKVMVWETCWYQFYKKHLVLLTSAPLLPLVCNQLHLQSKPPLLSVLPSHHHDRPLLSVKTHSQEASSRTTSCIQIHTTIGTPNLHHSNCASQYATWKGDFYLIVRQWKYLHRIILFLLRDHLKK